MCAAHQAKVQQGYTLPVCLVPKEVKTEPLDRMKDNQGQAEKEYVHCRKRIGNNTFHAFKIKKPPVNKRFI
jgi:hypothetical protein